MQILGDQCQGGVEPAALKLVWENRVVSDPASHSQHTHPTFGGSVEVFRVLCVWLGGACCVRMYLSWVHSKSRTPRLCPLLPQGMPGEVLGMGQRDGTFLRSDQTPSPGTPHPTQARAAWHFPPWFPPSPTPGGTLCDATGCVLVGH